MFHVKHPEARETRPMQKMHGSKARKYSPKARDFRRFIRRLFAKGPRRRQIKERGPRCTVPKYLIRLNVPRFVVPKARDLLGVVYFHDSCLWMADYVPDA